VYTAGLISGAHLNPAVSLAAVLARKMPFSTFFGYFLSQAAGGVLGALFFRLCFPTRELALLIAPVQPFHFGEAVLIEIAFTTMLCFVALNVTTSSSMQRNQFFGLAIGFVLVAGGYAAMQISGALFNPALSFGLGLCSFKLESFITGCLYALVELGGGIIAAGLFRICRHNEYSIAHELIYEVEGGEYVHPHEVTIIPTPSMPARVFAEFLGTFWVVLVFGLNTVLLTGATAWSVAGAFISMTYALGSVSGAHFNPAVTLAIMLSGRGRCSKKEGCWFMVGQFVAAIPGGLIVASAIPKLWGPWNETAMPGYMHTGAQATNLATDLTDQGLFAGYSRYNWYEIGLVETIFTFLLAYVVLVVSTSELHTISVSKSWPNFYFALAIGLATAGVVYAAGPVSGGYMNPAVALSFAVEGEPSFGTSADVAGWSWLANALIRVITSLVKGIRYYLAIFWYVIPEFVGAGLAALLFRLTHAAEYSQKDYDYYSATSPPAEKNLMVLQEPPEKI
jgi:aquaporin Z